MGIFQKGETHESRSSSMSYALRWKYGKINRTTLVALFLVALITMISILVYIQDKKQVSLVIDGEAVTLETREALLHELLQKENITLEPHDMISMPLNGAIQDGDEVVIKRAAPVQITADHQSKTLYTTEKTVGDAVKSLGYKVSSKDIVTPALDTQVSSNMDIKIVRVTTQSLEQEAEIPFQVIKTADPSLFKGDNRVLRSGKAGVMIQNIEKEYHDGVLISKRMVSKEVATNRVDRVVAVGTKKPVVLAASTGPANAKTASASVASTGNNVVSKAGIDFKYKKVLNNVSMTAYSSQEPGIGTRTASGTRVTEGRTIAVDPNVVPIGWWVYIEGLGFRRAEDTGGAIKGNKIDVYYDNLNHALNFGRKSGITVYVIGPVKPELN
ncbi:3D domain-containing protein [Paenibacillus massiliensis]|uniref:3D domain-containing protein n=1 Tax=Paenibacillus massiliensis TaxID=225917 RepID=UPI00040BD1C5|nr:3D domain-containing protein [Paenibacillus massiliensis]